jgi:acyl carrier protein
MELKTEIFRLLQEVAPEVDPEQIDLEQPLRDQVDIDSMDFLGFIGKIYEQLKVNIPESDYGRLRSVNDLLRYLEEKMKGP